MGDTREFLGGRVVVKVGDIIEERVDAIVNAANSSLMGGGGVDGAIHRRGGPGILEECRGIRKTRYPAGLPPGGAVSTKAGNLPARRVIHTVGPVWRSGKEREEEVLRRCYLSALRLAAEEGCESIAFPAISTGAFGFPKELAAKIASQAISGFLERDRRIRRVVLVFYSEEDRNLFLRNSGLRSSASSRSPGASSGASPPSRG
jgi:O-acetyl-ADP-ribose deacetylase (regulator of RNase III)